MKTTVLLNAAEDLPARAFCIANVRDKTIVKWLSVSEHAYTETQLDPVQLPCIVIHGSRFGEQCTAHVIEPGSDQPMNTPVSLKPARPESDE